MNQCNQSNQQIHFYKDQCLNQEQQKKHTIPQFKPGSSQSGTSLQVLSLIYKRRETR